MSLATDFSAPLQAPRTSIFASLSGIASALANAYAAAEFIQTQSARSDEALAADGLDRTDIARATFDRFYA